MMTTSYSAMGMDPGEVRVWRRDQRRRSIIARSRPVNGSQSRHDDRGGSRVDDDGPVVVERLGQMKDVIGVDPGALASDLLLAVGAKACGGQGVFGGPGDH